MKSYIKVLLILIIPLALIVGYSMCDFSIPSEELALEKIDLSDLEEAINGDTVQVADSASLVAEEEVKLDTARQRILFFGDSMVEGLAPRIGQYAYANNHDIHTICWYSSTTEIWSSTETLKEALANDKPTFVIITIGGNEQFVMDLDKRAKYVDKILGLIGDIPYVWIGTPAWKQDKGFNDLIRKRVGPRRYYESTRLTFERGKDHVHPTFSSAAMWMDSVAVWLQSKECIHPIEMKAPTEQVDRAKNKKWTATVLQPYKK